MSKTCPKCGTTKPLDATHFYRDKSKSSGYMSYCKVCIAERDIARWPRVTPRRMGRTVVDDMRVVKSIGCQVCGYASATTGLHPHHLDPSVKNDTGNGWTRERMEKELPSCVILCATCHAEVHERNIDLGGCILSLGETSNLDLGAILDLP